MLFNKSFALFFISFLFSHSSLADENALATQDKKRYEVDKTLDAFNNELLLFQAKTSHLNAKKEFENALFEYNENKANLEKRQNETNKPKEIVSNKPLLPKVTEQEKPKKSHAFDIVDDYYLTDLTVIGDYGQATLIYNGQEIFVTTDEHVNNKVILDGNIRVADINHYNVKLVNTKTGKVSRKYQRSINYVRNDIKNKNGIKTKDDNPSRNVKKKNERTVKVNYRTLQDANGG
ncbi:hypothetical protein [Photobacterium leiognathi]|uniref:hypothetical protein n=1 Tax=Photobacterium leiognathi TaxID=553611 RepID=UPI00298187C4|nr:hypothetical protein [Photobacterium leiognathi]